MLSLEVWRNGKEIALKTIVEKKKCLFIFSYSLYQVAYYYSQ